MRGYQTALLGATLSVFLNSSFLQLPSSIVATPISPDCGLLGTTLFASVSLAVKSAPSPAAWKFSIPRLSMARA
jgi:hypothetical protein